MNVVVVVIYIAYHSSFALSLFLVAILFNIFKIKWNLKGKISATSNVTLKSIPLEQVSILKDNYWIHDIELCTAKSIPMDAKMKWSGVPNPFPFKMKLNLIYTEDIKHSPWNKKDIKVHVAKCSPENSDPFHDQDQDGKDCLLREPQHQKEDDHPHQIYLYLQQMDNNWQMIFNMMCSPHYNKLLALKDEALFLTPEEYDEVYNQIKTSLTKKQQEKEERMKMERVNLYVVHRNLFTVIETSIEYFKRVTLKSGLTYDMNKKPNDVAKEYKYNPMNLIGKDDSIAVIVYCILFSKNGFNVDDRFLLSNNDKVKIVKWRITRPINAAVAVYLHAVSLYMYGGFKNPEEQFDKYYYHGSDIHISSNKKHVVVNMTLRDHL